MTIYAFEQIKDFPSYMDDQSNWSVPIKINEANSIDVAKAILKERYKKFPKLFHLFNSQAEAYDWLLNEVKQKEEQYNKSISDNWVEIENEFSTAFREFIGLTYESYKADYLKLMKTKLVHYSERYCLKTSNMYISYLNYTFFRKDDLEKHIYTNGNYSHGDIVEVFDMLENRVLRLRVRLIVLKEVR